MANFTFSIDILRTGKIKIVQEIVYQIHSEEYRDENQLTKDYARSKLVETVKKFYHESLKYVKNLVTIIFFNL
jgi:hypothetical protein